MSCCMTQFQLILFLISLAVRQMTSHFSPAYSGSWSTQVSSSWSSKTNLLDHVLPIKTVCVAVEMVVLSEFQLKAEVASECFH